MNLISTKILRIDYRHRGSASDYLEEFYRLGFHEIPTVDVGRTSGRFWYIYADELMLKAGDCSCEARWQLR